MISISIQKYDLVKFKTHQDSQMLNLVEILKNYQYNRLLGFLFESEFWNFKIQLDN